VGSFLEGLESLFHRKAPALRKRDATDTLNWCGTTLTASAGTLDTVYGEFTVPTPSARAGQAFPQTMSTWIGMDGHMCTSTLLQAGVVTEVRPPGH